MVEKIIDFCGRKQLIVFLSFLLILIWAFFAIRKTPLDAIPDLSDKQVIIFTEWMGRSPDLMEDQITYPIVTAFLAAPKVKNVRGFSMFGLSFVYVIFEDDTDIYWARSRAVEYLSNVQGQLPEKVTPQVGPDATGVGWVFEYALVDESGRHNLQELRSFQDWYLRYWLSSVPGVSEVASVGGYQKEYQVEIDPIKLQAYDLSVPQIKKAIQRSNNDVGGRVIEMTQREYIIRGRGYITDKEMLAKVVVGTDNRGTPITIGDFAKVQVGGNIRRGLVDLDGKGEVVGGIVVMRYGEDALKLINRVKQKFKEMEPAFPKGVKVVTTYDRSTLIKDSVKTLAEGVIEEVIIVCIIIFIFLLHVRSTLISVITLIVALVISFIPMYYMGITSNIMSLAGIIIAIGDVVDGAIVMTENAHLKLQENPDKDRKEVIIEAARDIGPSIFSSLLIIVVAFIPIFSLQAQEGLLFSPLAYTKTFAVLFGAILSITLVPALMVLFIRGKIRPAEKNPVNRLAIAIYKPILLICVRYRYMITCAAFGLILITIPAFLKLGSEFMPPLDEGTIMLMPITTPGISIEAAKNLTQVQDKILYSFPEVKSVFGKAGRAETSTDPAPLSMIEIIITLNPKSEWRKGMTKDLLVKEMDKALSLAGVQNAFTMPIKARLDMLTTGIRTPIGIKVLGDNLFTINEIGKELEAIFRDIPETRSVYAERELGGYFIDFTPNREAIARYGLEVLDLMDIVETSIGGLDISTTIEGRERYKINIRYPRELRNDVEKLKQVLVPIRINPKEMPPGRFEHVPLGQLGEVKVKMDAPMIKDEGGSLSGWIYVDPETNDIGGYVKKAKTIINSKLKLPKGYFLKWTGQYEYLERMQNLMKSVVPLTLLIILIILYFNFKGLAQTLIVMLSVPFAAIGGIWLMFFLNYNTSVAVWVGMIALLGIAAQTASIMVTYLDKGFLEWSNKGNMNSKEDLIKMVIEYGSSRVRPLIMAVGLNIMGLIPIMLAKGTGSDIAKRIAAPLWGGLLSLTLLTLLVIPAIYVIWRNFHLKKQLKKDSEIIKE